jgi:hypothetical protein
MPHPEGVRSPAANAATDAAFEEIRQSFIVLLGAEQERLAYLRHALQAADGFPVAVFEELERFAHRLRGAAAVFALPQLRDAAGVLELASSAALARHASNRDPRLRRSTRMLAAQLTRTDAPAAG